MTTSSHSREEKLGALSSNQAKLLELLLAKRSVTDVKQDPRNEDRLPASGAQQRLWFIDRLEGHSIAYHIPRSVRMSGKLDRIALQASLDALIERHEALRAVFVEIAGELVQRIVEPAGFPLEFVNLGALDTDERDVELHRHLSDEIAAPFDLSAGPLIRGRLLQLSLDEHVLQITVHHIVADGWSMAVFVRELGALYEAHVEGRPNPLPPLAVRYADHVHRQQRSSGSKELEEHLNYWKQHLQGAPDLLELPTDRPRPAVQTFRGANAEVSLGADLAFEVRALARRFNVTLAMVLHAAWSIVLSKLSGLEDIVIGVPVANRRSVELEALIGFFVSTLAVRVRLDGDLQVSEFLGQVKRILLQAYTHQDVPFERVVEVIQPPRTLSYNPIFQVTFVLQNAPLAAMQLQGLTLQKQEVPQQTAHFDLTLSLQESQEDICGTLNYASDLFDAETIARWIGHFKVVLGAMVAHPARPIKELTLLSREERTCVIDTFNATGRSYSSSKVIQQYLEEQVERTPDAEAVVYEGQSLSYAQLNARANQLASFLRDKGVGPDRLVGICVERSLEMVVSLFAVLKAGGAYVPLDPVQPRERLSQIIQDSEPVIVLTQARLQERLEVPHGCQIVVVDADVWERCEWGRAAVGNPDPAQIGLTSEHLAYVIYTSGSTGIPKGVLIEHRHVLNLWQGLEHVYRSSGPCQRVALNASFTFDASVQQFVQLLSGRTLVVVPQQVRLNAPELLAQLAEKRVDAIDCTPGQLKVWIDAGLLADTRDHRPRVVLVGGESIDNELWSTLARCSDVHFYNVYGPTEITVDATCGRIDGRTLIPHIGSPMENRRIYILDARMQPVPVGVTGEIYIGGAGVARGYLRRDELTAQRFVADPFSADATARMYKSGDLGRWRADGTIECLGRNDHQVKIRGFRIELGEIETQLRRHAQVKDAVVVAREDVPGEKRLVAYVVHALEAVPTIEELRSHVKAVLPDYMVPSAFVLLERLPLNTSGKVDRRALPAPQLDAYVSRQYEAPQGELEEILAGIWQALLRVDGVSRNDNFFELGGHSLLIVQLIERLRRVGLSVELRRIFESPTLAELARGLATEPHDRFEVPRNKIPPDCDSITPELLPLVSLEQEHIDRIVSTVCGGAANIEDIYPLAASQEGILFHHLLSENGSDAYVVATLLRLASRERLDALIDALQAVIDQHDVFRTAIQWEQLPQPVQVVYRRASLPVSELAVNVALSSNEQINEWMRAERQTLDLRQAPLIRLHVAQVPGSTEWYALMQMHHIVVDAVSGKAMVSDIVARLENPAEPLPPSLPYRNHVAQSLAYSGSHDAATFFRGKLGDIDEPTAPFGLLDVHGDGTHIEQAWEALDPLLASDIRRHARRLGVSAATVFHAAWAIVVSRTSGREDVVFGTVLLGRMQGSAGAQRTLGMFIKTLPLRLSLRTATATALIEHTQRELVELLSHEQASLAVAQRCSGIVGSAPLFTSLLNYRHKAGTDSRGWADAAGVRLLLRRNATNYPMTVSVDDEGDGFSITTQTDARVSPSRLLGYLRTALRSLVSALETPAQNASLSLSILTDDERSQLIADFNPTQRFPQGKLIHQLFEEQVVRTPKLVAVVHGQQLLTYEEVNRSANQLARYLKIKGVDQNGLVGICVERCPDMIVGLLGILKAGGAYMPLDPSYPPERLEYMISDGAPQVIVTQSSVRSILPATDAPVIELDTQRDELDSYPTDNLPLDGQSRADLLYVIYTSGSTGRPKGTAMPHGSMVNLIEWHREAFGDRSRSRVLQFAALSFDVAFQETFTTLCTGGALVLLDEWVRRDASALLELLSTQYVERLFVPPLMLQSIAEYFQVNRLPLMLKDVITAGEQLRMSPEIVQLFEALDGCRLHNHYGPTETHVVTALTLDGDPIAWPLLPTIGRPIANARIYILDSERQLLPTGVAGEIYIGGVALARGYLHRPELTEERFVSDPFSDDPLARMYKTGDLGRWSAEGTIEYLGRNDDQVKIRGFRIELGEVEAQLALHEDVKEAAVIAREDIPGQKRLVAYVTTSRESAPSAEALRIHLKSRLPDYMVPSAFVVLESLPLTPSGKLNRRALPAPDSSDRIQVQYDPPQGSIEETLASIWQEQLSLERVGREDNFFEIGGHSLLVLKVLFKVNHALGCALKVTDLYKSPTIRELAAHIGGQTVKDEYVDLSREAALGADIIMQAAVASVAAKGVLLTGATGFVGRFLLAELLETSDATIYCMVRAQSNQDALIRLRASLAAWDLWREDVAGRVIAVRGDLRQPRLGLDEPTYRMLAQGVDTIYHCATSMNHLETYAMAKSANVDASKEMLRLATRGRAKVVNYVSTLGVFAASANGMPRSVDESSSIDRERHLSSHGYAASKWVGEKIFMTANERGIPCNIFRVGLVWADTKLGRYDELQRGYRILKSCLLSGCGIRNYKFDMAPTPVDHVARAIVFLANEHGQGGGVFHVASGAEMHDGIFERSNEIAGTELELMSFYDWIGEMKRLHRDGMSMPVVPLIEFAFSMSESEFDEHRRRTRSNLRVDCMRTQQALQRGGLVIPEFGDELVDLTVRSMLVRDPELRDIVIGAASPNWRGMASSARGFFK